MAFHCTLNPIHPVTSQGLAGLASKSLLDLVLPCSPTLSPLPSLSGSGAHQACSYLRVLELASPSAWNALPQIFVELVPLTIQVSSQMSPLQRGLPCPRKPAAFPLPWMWHTCHVVLLYYTLWTRTTFVIILFVFLFIMSPLAGINSMRVYHICFISWDNPSACYIVDA